MRSAPRLLLITGALLLTSNAWALALTRGPYLGRPDDQSVAIVWRTDLPSNSRVDYAATGDGTDQAAWRSVRVDESVTTHKVRIAGLISGGMYNYQVFSDDLPLGQQGSFRAPRDSSESEFEFAVIGDTNQRWIPAIIAGNLANAAPDFAIHTGDIVYPTGSDDLYDAEFFTPLEQFLMDAPVLPTFGDHDARTDNGQPRLDNFVVPDSGTTEGSRFYAFRQANALFVAVDMETSAFGRGSVQYDWLIRTLSTSDATWKFVYVHEPPYSSDRSSGIGRIVLSPLFERYGVDIVFSGNSHLYERTYPICDFGSPQCRGVIYITEGGGGAAFSDFRPQSFTAFVMARHGHTIVSIAGNRLLLTSHSLDDTVVDSLELQKNSP